LTLDTIRQRYCGKSHLEWERLEATPFNRVEYLTTSHCLRQYLPDGGLVLDAGCGPGRYAIDLARQGCKVVLCDLVEEMLTLAGAKLAEAHTWKRIRGRIAGDIAHLPFDGETFDGVVCLGAPLSHLTEAGLRAQAVAELTRVTKPGGLVLLTGIQRLAIYRAAIYWGQWDLFDQFLSKQFVQEGVIDGSQRWYLFATGELEALATNAGLTVVDRVGCESLASYLPMQHLEELERDPERLAAWQQMLLQACHDPTIIGVSCYLLVVARKQGQI